MLDFIGNTHRQFRFDVRYRAILGGTRRRIAEEIEEGFPHLPPGCSMQLDRQAQDVVLGNVRRALDLGWRGLVDDLRGLGDVGLATFLEGAGVDLDELYRGGRCWSDLRRAAGLQVHAPGPDESHLARALGRLIHLDDPDRLDAWRVWLSEGVPPPVAPVGTWENRLQRMLFVGLGHVRQPLAELQDAFDGLWKHPAIRSELLELLEVLDNRMRRPTAPPDGLGDVPLRTHATYSLDEIMAGFGVERSGRIYRPRGQGVWHEPSAKADLLFVTLEKTEKEYSSTTLYEDYPMSPTEFHWESQNSTSSTSPVGRRYLDGSSRVLIFARERRKDERNITMPYVLLGRARYVRHESERPMRIVWRLDRPMPPDWYSDVKLAAG